MRVLKITRVGVLALQGDVREHLAALDRCGAAALPVRSVAELDSIDALVIPGGESTTMGRLMLAFDLEEPLRRRLAEGLPTLTTCAGLILLSRTVSDGRPDQLTLGVLDIALRRNGWGSQVESFEEDVRVSGLGDVPLRAVFIRAPRIEEVGPEVEVLATIGDEPVAIAQGPHLGLTFHPEMSGDDRLHQLFLGRIATAGEQSAA